VAPVGAFVSLRRQGVRVLAVELLAGDKEEGRWQWRALSALLLCFLPAKGLQH
jgi:hypothetical protein